MSEPRRGDRRDACQSIWERRNGGWINIFSQDTPLTGAGVP
jgi:hypothetical protein